LHAPLKVPHTLSIRDLFHQFKRKHVHMAIVLDEHGGTAGLVTMEDLLEELVGDIEDEDDLEVKAKKIDKNTYELSGRTELDEVAELTGLEFDYPEYKTVSFLITELLGSLAKEGEKIRIKKWEFTVTKMLRNTILTVLLKKIT
jgi:CBS domain containing-hemolysin-like protein